MKLYERFIGLLVVACFVFGFLCPNNVEEENHELYNPIVDCQPVERIAFLKTHKTGSETMAGILRKFAILNQKSTLLSKKVSGHLYHKGEHKHAPINENIKMLGYGHREFIKLYLTHFIQNLTYN